MTPPQRLTGTRRAILRSVYVAVLCAALAALVTSMLPGREIVYPLGAQLTHDAPGRYDAAGGPLVALAMVAATLLAGVGLIVPRRETTVLAAGTLTVLAIPIGIWLALSRLDDPWGVEARTLWPAQVLDLSLPVVVVAGPLLAVVGSILFRLEARTGRPTIPVATARDAEIR